MADRSAGGWHLKPSVTWGLILAIAGNLVMGGVMWGQVATRVERNERDIDRTAIQMREFVAIGAHITSLNEELERTRAEMLRMQTAMDLLRTEYMAEIRELRRLRPTTFDQP